MPKTTKPIVFVSSCCGQDSADFLEKVGNRMMGVCSICDEVVEFEDERFHGEGGEDIHLKANSN